MNPDLIASLHPPRLPEDFAAWSAGDLLTAFGLGLLLAALILTILSPLLRKRVRPPGMAQRIAAAEALPPAERMLELTRLLAERGGTLPEDQRHALYAGDHADPAALEALIRRRRR